MKIFCPDFRKIEVHKWAKMSIEIWGKWISEFGISH